VSFQPTPAEIADRYADAYARITTMAGGLGKEDLSVTVPGTPKWTVHGLLSHLVGAPVDFANGRLDGAGEDHWTQKQVDDRVGYSLDQILEEWEGVRPGLDAAVRGGGVPSPISFDILTHESDLRGALGLPPTPDPAGIRFVSAGFGARAISATTKAGLPPLRLVATDTGWSIGDEGGVTATATEHEWTRVLTGRRSNAQAGSLDWSDDPAPYLPLLSVFGPLREDDVKE
jgi:uncharacterized protein (TIGR03083 family)